MSTNDDTDDGLLWEPERVRSELLTLRAERDDYKRLWTEARAKHLSMAEKLPQETDRAEIAEADRDEALVAITRAQGIIALMEERARTWPRTHEGIVLGVWASRLTDALADPQKAATVDAGSPASE